MEISEQVKQLLPARYEIDAQNIEYVRVLEAIQLPDASRTPSEHNWLWRGPVIESYFVAIDKQLYVPDHQTVVLNIRLEENKLSFGRAAFWKGHLWGYSPILGLGPENHPVEHNGWSWTVFQGIITHREFQRLTRLDRTYHWMQLARGESS